MSITLFRPHFPLLLAALALFFAGIAFTQDKPDRPPWAQKTKSSSSANSTSNSSLTGEPGKIQIAPKTRELLAHRFELEERSVIEVRGKGPMITWFLIERRPPESKPDDATSPAVADDS